MDSIKKNTIEGLKSKILSMRNEITRWAADKKRDSEDYSKRIKDASPASKEGLRRQKAQMLNYYKVKVEAQRRAIDRLKDDIAYYRKSK